MHKGLKLTGPATAGRQLWGGGEGGLNVRYLFYMRRASVFVFSYLYTFYCICVCLKGATDSQPTVLVWGESDICFCKNRGG